MKMRRVGQCREPRHENFAMSESDYDSSSSDDVNDAESTQILSAIGKLKQRTLS
jgi:hypothetical protein